MAAGREASLATDSPGRAVEAADVARGRRLRRPSPPPPWVLRRWPCSPMRPLAEMTAIATVRAPAGRAPAIRAHQDPLRMDRPRRNFAEDRRATAVQGRRPAAAARAVPFPVRMPAGRHGWIVGPPTALKIARPAALPPRRPHSPKRLSRATSRFGPSASSSNSGKPEPTNPKIRRSIRLRLPPPRRPQPSRRREKPPHRPRTLPNRRTPQPLRWMNLKIKLLLILHNTLCYKGFGLTPPSNGIDFLTPSRRIGAC